MTSIRLDMTMSLDGFVAGPDDRTGQEMGRGGFRLFNWLDDRNTPGPNHDVYADSMAGKDVMVHGAGAAQALIRAGELDEIEVLVAPVLLGAGRRLFDLLDDLAQPVELELVRVVEGRDATHLRYGVVRNS